MAYYKLKTDSQFANVTIADCDEWLGKRDTTSSGDKILFVAEMINNYYNNNLNEKYSKIKWGIMGLIYKNKEYDKYEYLRDLLVKESHTITEDDWYSLECNVEDYEQTINNIIEDLMVLATVQFVPDNRYSDTPKTIMEYLSYNYVNEVKEKLDYLDEVVTSYTMSKFILEECEEVSE